MRKGDLGAARALLARRPEIVDLMRGGPSGFEIRALHITWKCAVVRDPIGEPTKRPATVTIPNIKVEVSMADYDAWLWLREVHARNLRSEQREGRPLLVRVLRRGDGVRDHRRGPAEVS